MKIVSINILVILCSSLAQGATWADVYPNVKPSIAMIISSGNLCAGALIEKDLILTAAHCVDRFRPISVSWSGSATDFESAKVVTLNSKQDLALIRLSQANSRKALPMMERGKRLLEGTPIATLGHPSIGRAFESPPFDPEMTYLMSSGIISGWTQDDFISDFSLSPGNSGGPVFNQESEIIGVVSRKRVDRYVGAIGFSASLNKVYEMLDAYHSQKDPELTWRHAKSNGSVFFGYSGHTYLESLGGSKQLLYVGVNFDYKDRFRFSLADNFSTTRSFQDYGLGYKMAFETKNRGMIYLTPSVEFISYDVRATGAGIDLVFAPLHLGLKYMGFEIDDQYHSVTSLLLVF